MYGILDENSAFILADENLELLRNTIPHIPNLDATDIEEYQDSEIEKGYDERWYLKGHTPEKPALTAEETRKIRDTYLLETDKYMIADYPIASEERESYIGYREYLRGIPQQQEFPDIKIETFAEWKIKAA